MNTDSEANLLFKSETREIINWLFRVLNTFGHSFHEKVYESALVVEFRLRGIPHLRQP